MPQFPIKVEDWIEFVEGDGPCPACAVLLDPGRAARMQHRDWHRWIEERLGVAEGPREIIADVRRSIFDK